MYRPVKKREKNILTVGPVSWKQVVKGRGGEVCGYQALYNWRQKERIDQEQCVWDWCL